MRSLSSFTVALAAGFIATATTSSTAHAGGFAFPVFGGEQGHPTTDNATAIYYNPAAMTQIEGLDLRLDATLVLRNASWEHAASPSDDTSVAGANFGKASLSNVLFSPFLGGVYKTGDWAFGAGAYAPIGGSAKWDKNNAFRDDPNLPGPVDGVQRWHNISGSLSSLYFTGAAAWQPIDILSVGLSLNAILSDAESTRARIAQGTNNLMREGRSTFTVSGWQWSFGAGVMLEPVEEELWLGVSYQSAPNLDGKFQLDGELTNAFPPSGRNPAAKVELNQRYPDMVRAGGRFRPLETVEVRVFYDFQRWSHMREQCLSPEDNECKTFDDGSNVPEARTIFQNVKRNWNNTHGLRAGASWWTSTERDLELYVGGGYETGAVPDATLDPTISDTAKWRASAGGRFRIGGDVHVSLTYTYMQFLKKNNTGESLFPFFEGASRAPDGGGIYEQSINFFNAGIDVGF